MSEPMLTTVDNPYNPHTDYEKWLKWDRDNEYYTSEYLARLVNLDAETDEAAASEVIEEAYREILDNDTNNVYMVV